MKLEQILEAERPKEKLTVYRLGRERSLVKRNAGTVEGVGMFIYTYLSLDRTYEGAKRFAESDLKGKDIMVFDVEVYGGEFGLGLMKTYQQYRGTYKEKDASYTFDPAGKSVGYEQMDPGVIWYSFPDGHAAYKYKFKKAVPAIKVWEDKAVQATAQKTPMPMVELKKAVTKAVERLT